MKGIAKFGEFLEESSPPSDTGGVGATENMAVVFSRVMAQGTPIGITRVVSVDDDAGREKVMASFDKMGTSVGIGVGS